MNGQPDGNIQPSSSSPAPASASELSRALAAAVAAAAPSVVQVEARPRRASSGIVVSADGLIAAADHTVERDEEISVGLADGTRLAATLVGRDSTTDLALLRVAASGLAAPRWSDLQHLEVGHLVLAVGRPGRHVRASLGLVSDLRDAWRTPGGGRIDRYLATDAPRERGFSGSLLVDAAGAALGLATTGLLRGRALTVPGATLGRVVEALLAHGRVRRAYLGVGTVPVRLPPPLAAELGQPAALVVLGVQPESPAERAGVLLGDLLLALGGQPTGDLAQLHAYLGEERLGEEVPLAVLRAGERRELTVTLGFR